jgi:alkaline phosphatase D
MFHRSLPTAWALWALAALSALPSILGHGALHAQRVQLRPIVHGAAPVPGAGSGTAQGWRAGSVDPRLAPFYHGVASGDPSADGVLLWTRVTPDNPGDVSSVDWELSPDTAFSSILQSGTVTTDSSRDHTVKVAVTGLAEGTTYYYRFRTGGVNSLIGRTRTADQDASQLKFAVVSCNDYQGGYFNAFGRIAERNDLDAVVHLGDFIYEYESNPGDPDRGNVEPENETLSAEDYRTRYGWYRLDPDLRRAMQQHPFIFVWDDHESANNAWTDGAEAHDPLTEGDWENRKNRARRVYFEWVPVPDEPDFKVYRRVSYGSLAEWHMLDTRLEGREEQLMDHTNPALWDPARTMLGATQFAWLNEGLRNSAAQWKLVGNQVVFAPLLLAEFEGLYPGAQDQFLDVWNGYPAERSRLLDSLSANGIQDVVFATGDVHISLAFDVPDWDGDSLFYDPATAAGSRAVEFVTPSISSSNFDEVIGAFITNLIEGEFLDENPHGAFNDFDRHGYLIMDLTPTRAQSDWYFVDTKDEPSTVEAWETGLFTLTGENRLQTASAEAPPKAIQEDPAPDPTAGVTGLAEAPALHLWSVYPNPVGAERRITAAFSVQRGGPCRIYLSGLDGRVLQELYNGEVPVGHYELRAELDELPAGQVVLTIEQEGLRLTRRLVLH